MKSVFFRALIASLAVGGGSSFCFAQDIHPYQSQTSIRLTDARMGTGLVEALPAVTASEWKYSVSGSFVPQIAYNTALMYDKRTIVGPTVIAGGNYAFDASGYMFTLSADGFLYSKGKQKYQPGVAGGVYFVDSATNHIVVVDSWGSPFDSTVTAPSIRVVGGNYFIDSNGIITTVKSMGVSQNSAAGMIWTRNSRSDATYPGVTQPGGNFFVTAAGAVITVSSKDGSLSSPYTPDAPARLVGGNYFVGTDNLLYTVSFDGSLKKNTDYTVGAVSTRGSSFLKMADGTFIFVDASGMPHRTLMHVALNANASAPVNQLPDSIDANSIFLPKILN